MCHKLNVQAASYSKIRRNYANIWQGELLKQHRNAEAVVQYVVLLCVLKHYFPLSTGYLRCACVCVDLNSFFKNKIPYFLVLYKGCQPPSRTRGYPKITGHFQTLSPPEYRQLEKMHTLESGFYGMVPH